MSTTHQRAVALALRTNDDLAVLFAALGNITNQRGVWSIYALIADSLSAGVDDLTLLTQQLRRLQSLVSREIDSLLSESESIGVAAGVDLIGVYQLAPVVGGAGGLLNVARDAVMAIVRAQSAAAIAQVVLGNTDIAQIIGDTTRIGILSYAPVAREAARWIAATTHTAQLETVTRSLGTQTTQYGMQAIAAIDERTTDCCLRVHGQVVAIDGEFVLTGTPRYADRMKNPGFHHWCRTSTALVRLDMAEDDLTRILRAAADAELAARAAKDKTPFSGTINAGSVRDSQRGRLRRAVFGG